MILKTHICSGPEKGKGLPGNIPQQVFVILSMNRLKNTHAET